MVEETISVSSRASLGKSGLQKSYAPGPNVTSERIAQPRGCYEVKIVAGITASISRDVNHEAEASLSTYPTENI